MELLTPLTKALPDPIPEETVVKIAKDMCHALSLCKRFDIVHRDIKPQNIFVSPLGDYKLGDFGIAKTVEKTMGGTKTGTYKYMAPEVYNNQPYGHSADIYSLGLVLYWMLNRRRMPFMPLPPQKLTAGMDEQARNRRLSGEPLPPPADGSEALKRIVLKACAYDPKERYHSADEMLADLNALEDERSRPAVRLTSPAQDSQPIPQPATLADEEGTVGAFGRSSATAGASIARPTGPLDEDEATVGAFGAAAQKAPANPKTAQKPAPGSPEPKPLAAEPKAAHAIDSAKIADTTVLKTKKKSKTPLIAAIAAVLAIVIGLVIWKPWASNEDQSQSDASKWNLAGTTNAPPTESGKTETKAAEGENKATEDDTTASSESKTLNTSSTSADDASYPDVHIAIINSGAKSYDDAVISGARTWCEQNSAIKSPKIYNPADDSTDAFIEAIETAIDEGNQFLIFDSYMQAKAIAETVDDYPDVCFICLDISEWDLQAGRGTESDFSWDYPQNLYIATFREEQAGYLAGYAAVKMGYRELGFLGGMPVPAVVKYGYGFVQGANDAAIQNGVASEVRIKYVYGSQFYGDADIDAYMENWYKNGTSVVFAAGGMIYTSAAQAAAHYGGKVIGMDVDQAKDIDGQYGDGITLTSAVKGYGPAAASYLTRIMSEGLKGGRADFLGINTDDPAKSFIQLAPSTQYQGIFGKEDYKDLLHSLHSGELTVSADISSEPVVSITVDYQGNIK